MPKAQQERLSISKAALLLGRTPAAIRTWDRKGMMPDHLRPYRDQNNNRYWTLDLIDEIKTWIEENNFHPGSALDYHPTPREVERHIAGIRVAMKKHVRSSGAHRQDEERFEKIVRYAYEVMKISQEDILAKVPSVVAGYKYINIQDALAIVADVFEASALE